MDQIQKNLEGYLEEKRELFPRFYFISNDELLQILAHQADLKAIEKQVKKCFENLNSFVLIDDLAEEEKELKIEQKYIEFLKSKTKTKNEGSP
jgi:dynein heavy chain